MFNPYMQIAKHLRERYPDVSFWEIVNESPEPKVDRKLWYPRDQAGQMFGEPCATLTAKPGTDGETEISWTFS